MPYVAWLDGSRLPNEEAGGKMGSLAELVGLGLEVPPGYVVSARAFSDFVTHHGIDAAIAGFSRRIAGSGTSDDPSVVQEARAIRSAIRASQLMPELAREIVAGYHQILATAAGQPCAVSVRSSALFEDKEARSCAGMYDTFLMINDEAVLCDMVKLCWVSLFSDRSITYLKTKGGVLDDAASWRMAVGVQRMVNARTAGVAMTVNPTTGDRSKIYVEGSWGLGESLVQGLVDPDCFKVDKVTLEWLSQDIGSKRERLVCNYETGTVEQVEVEEAQRRALCLDERELVQIARAAKLIEKHYGAPQDVEWAISGENESAVLHLLQARPQTAVPKQGPRSSAGQKSSAVEYVVGLFR